MATGPEKEKKPKKQAAEKAAPAEQAAEKPKKAPAKKKAEAAPAEAAPVAEKKTAPARPRRGAAPRPPSDFEAKAIAKYVRMAPRKLRLVIDAIRGKSVQEARSILTFSNKRAAVRLLKVLNSAVANAENNHRLNVEALVVSTAYVDQGPTFKGWIPRARGRASTVHKKSSHITIALKERG